MVTGWSTNTIAEQLPAARVSSFAAPWPRETSTKAEKHFCPGGPAKHPLESALTRRKQHTAREQRHSHLLTHARGSEHETMGPPAGGRHGP